MERYVLNTAEKVDVIYDILREGESRRRRAFLFRILKWVIIFAAIYLLYTNPKEIMGRITETLKPLILSTASGMISTQKAELTNALKDLLPAGVEIK